MDVGGQLGVVVADDRELVREGEAEVLGDGEPGDRHHVVGVDDRGGRRPAVEQRAGRGDAARGGEVGDLEQLRLEPQLAHRALPGVPAARRVQERRPAGDVGDPLVAELGEVAHGGDDPARSSRQTAGNGTRLSGRPMVTAGRPSSRHSATRGSSKRRSVRKTPSTRPLLREPRVARGLAARVVTDHLQHERLLERSQLRLDAGDEGREEGVGPEQRGVAGEDEAERVGARLRERAGSGARAASRARRPWRGCGRGCPPRCRAGR